jgi:4-amino-4-deoxy-L-arabinose transferase-like glycosyltransferase
LQLARRYRIPALFCAFAVLVCALLSYPYANMGISDDGPYILMAQHLATTGHVVYNGWAAPMLIWQLYLAAAFVKLFGFSFTTVRSCTLFTSVALAFLLQRTLVRANISERNATLGTLAFVLSPLYLMLSVTFMTDITGLFAIVFCLYGCLRALQSSTSHAAIGWLCLAIATNALCGTSRQIAWLGVLVMVPSTLWLLRSQRRVLLAGAAATLTGALFILCCMLWLSHQPYIQPEPLLPHPYSADRAFWQLIHFFMDFPFLLLPVVALFLPRIRRCRPVVLAILAILFAGYLVIALQPQHRHGIFMLEPSMDDGVEMSGVLIAPFMQGSPPLFLHRGLRALLTIVSFGGLFGLISCFFLPSLQLSPAANPLSAISRKQLGVLIIPYAIVYSLLLVPRAGSDMLFDRYSLGLLIVALLCLVRYYQNRIQPRLPLAGFLLVGVVAIAGIALTHNMFALARGRLALAAELRAHGIPDTSVDNGWEYNLLVELEHSNYINNSRIVLPAHAYVPIPPPAGPCRMFYYDKTPHIHPHYGVSFAPNACYGPAPFAPVHYSRWPYRTHGTLYVVQYVSP